MAAAVTASPAMAQEAQMATTVVTAARSETPIDATLADITVIDRAQLAQMGPGRSLADVLQRMAGVQVSSNGGRGQAQSVFVRGAGSSQSLLLIDGVRYGSAVSAAPSLANIPLELIERVEVLKGPASALYGSEAMGGVIHIITRRGKAVPQPFQADASVTTGSYGHNSGAVNLRGAHQGWDYQLGMSRVEEQGQSAVSPNDAVNYHPDRDAFDQTAAHIGLGLQLHQLWRVDTVLNRTDGRVFTDEGLSTQPWTDMRTQAASVKLSGQPLSAWKTEVMWGQSKDYAVTWGSPYGESLLNTQQTQYKWDNTVATPWGAVLSGLERLEQTIDTTTPYAIKSRTIDSAFVGLNGSAGRHSWQFNLRGDDNSQFGTFTTYGLNYGLALTPGLKLLAGHGKSMRGPSFGDLYGVWAGPHFGNPTLRPERGRNNELALQWRAQDQQVKLTRYVNRIDDLITGGVTSMVNAQGRTYLKGWTLDYQVDMADWQMAVSWDQLSVREASGLSPVRRAKHQMTWRFDRTMGPLKLGASALYMGARNDFSYGGAPSYTSTAVVLPAYTTIDVHAQYQLLRDWSVQARMANVTDKRYETAYGFTQLGRAAYLTLKWSPR